MTTRRKDRALAKRSAERITASSGNIFADLGFRNAEDLHMRGQLIFQINAIVQELGLTQTEASRLLDIDQADVSRLMNGEFVRRFTVERLFRLLNKLGRDVEIVIKPKGRGRTAGQVSVALPG